MKQEEKWHSVSRYKGEGESLSSFVQKVLVRGFPGIYQFLSTHSWIKKRESKEREIPKHIKMKDCRVYVVLYPSPLSRQPAYSFRDALHPSCARCVGTSLFPTGLVTKTTARSSNRRSSREMKEVRQRYYEIMIGRERERRAEDSCSR
jgi:hypothetical protein